MEEEIYVSCHAPSLSFLLFETARSLHDQKGLLIGQICNEVISKKTDENEVNREHKTVIYLEHCIPVNDRDIIDNTGSVNEKKFKKLIEALQNKVVGWYSFRRNSRLTPCTLSELIIHKSLLRLVPNVQCQYFVACFLSSSAAANMSTHTFNHIFMNYDPDRAKFESLRLKIYTLSDKSVNSNGYLMKNPFPTSRIFEKIINCNQKEETPVKSVLKIHERISALLKQMDQKLQNEDKHRLILEEEVKALRKKLESGKKGDIFMKEPKQKELKTKIIHYNPNVKYGPSKKVHKLSFPLERISSFSGNSEEEKKNLKYRRNDTLEVSPDLLPTENESKVETRNYSKGNTCVGDFYSYTPDIDEKKKNQGCSDGKQGRSMEY